MKFLIDYSKKPCEYTPIYIEDENSFSIKEDYTVDDIALMVGSSYTYLGATTESNTVCYIYGMNPKSSWEKAEILFPDAKPGKLYFEADEELIPSAGYDAAELGKVYFDPKSRTICIGEKDADGREIVLFNTNTAAAVKDGKLCAVWVKLD